jgi:hypothetical protein
MDALADCDDCSTRQPLLIEREARDDRRRVLNFVLQCAAEIRNAILSFRDGFGLTLLGEF